MANKLNPGLHKFGVVAKAHGTRGGLLIEVIGSDIPAEKPDVVYLRSSEKQWVPHRLLEIRTHFDRRRNLFFVMLEGISTRTQAESLRGEDILSDFDVSNAGQQILSVIGYQVIRIDESVLGFVSDVLETPAYDVLIVQAEYKQILIPHVEEYILDVNDSTNIVIVQNTNELEALE